MVVVRWLHPEIAKVQTRAAFLLSVSESSRLRDPTVLEAEAAALASIVEAYSATLAQQLSELPQEVRNHGRVVDTVKALRSVHGILGRAKAGFSRTATTPDQWQKRPGADAAHYIPRH